MPDQRDPTTDERLKALEHGLQQLRDSRSQLSDAITVLNHAQRLHGESIAEHKLWLGEMSMAQARLTEAQAKTQEQLRESDARTEKRIADLVSAIGAFMNRPAQQ